jgi:glycosyltransferase involved in cell wall biosynthesis
MWKHLRQPGVDGEEMTHFKIIVPMYNCSLFSVGCLESIRNQNYPNWQAVIIVEPSTDNTLTIVKDYLNIYKDPRFLLIENKIQVFAVRNYFNAIHLCNPLNEDVLVFLDGDDEFYATDVLSHLNLVYVSEDVWVTWGSYIMKHNKSVGGASTPEVDPQKDEHKGERWWRFSHLKTLKYFLFKGINPDDLRDNTTKEYYKVAQDMAIMFPAVEMAGKQHRKFIQKILYIYNYSNPLNDEKIHYADCVRCSTEIRNRPKYQLRSKEDLCQIPSV